MFLTLQPKILTSVKRKIFEEKLRPLSGICGTACVEKFTLMLLQLLRYFSRPEICETMDEFEERERRIVTFISKKTLF